MTPTINDADFQAALKFDLDHEGRVVENVSGDPGGWTKWGITWRDYFAFLKEHSRPVPSEPSAVRGATAADISQIYLEHYWIPLKGADLPSPLDEVLFDCAVNTGMRQSVLFLQRILGITQDGNFGPNTQAITMLYISKHGQQPLVDALLARRKQFYTDLAANRPGLRKFLGGWYSRVADLFRATRGAK